MLLTEFNAAADELLQLLSSFTEDQLNHAPMVGRWTPGQVGHHLLKSYQSISVMNGRTEATARRPDEKIERLRSILLNYDTKISAPEGVIPSDSPINKEKLLASLQEVLDQFRKVISTKDLSRTCLDFSIPNFGEFTRLEWVYFNVYHTIRHNHQLKQMADESVPLEER